MLLDRSPHGFPQPDTEGRIYLHAILHPSEPPGPTFLGVPGCLFGHSAGQLHDHNLNSLGCPSPHPHVLLPQPALLPGCLPFFCGGAKDPGELPTPTSHHRYNQCLAQAFFLIGFAGCEPALLAVMAYDRYAAICQPLHYAHLMRGKVCISLSVAIWLCGFLNSTIYSSLASRLDFCGNNKVPHIFCDVPPLLKIACSDTWVNELTNHITSIFVGLGPFLFIILSYFLILISILKIRSNTGRLKAFSTCASHIAVVMLCIGNGYLNYNQPSAGYSIETGALASTSFCIVTPMLNPLIYSLRNKEVKGALRKVLSCRKTALY